MPNTTRQDGHLKVRAYTSLIWAVAPIVQSPGAHCHFLPDATIPGVSDSMHINKSIGSDTMSIIISFSFC